VAGLGESTGSSKFSRSLFREPLLSQDPSREPREELITTSKWGRSRRRRLLSALVVGVLALAVAGVLVARSLATTKPAVELTQASLATVSSTVDVSGTLQPATEIGLDFGSSGIVSAVDVKPGQSVKAGAVLASLDATSVQAQLTEAELAVAEDQAKLAADEAGPTPTEAAQAEASLKSAEQSLTEAKASYSTSTAATVAADEATAVSDAAALKSATYQVAQAEGQVSQDTNTLAADQANVAATEQSNADALTSAQDAENQASQDLSDAEQTLSDDSGALASAETLAGGNPPSATTDATGVVSYYQSLLAPAEQRLQGCQDTATSGSGGAQCSAYSQSVANLNAAIADAEKVVADTEAVASAQGSLQEAEGQISSTQDKGAQALAQAEESVTAATQALDEAQTSLAADQASEANQAESTLAAAAVAKSEACPTQATSAPCQSATAAYNAASSVLQANPSALQAAQVLETATEAKDAQALQSADAAIQSAKVALANTQAENAAEAAPPPATTIQTDQDVIQSAEAQVRNLEDQLAQTRLVAPVSGVVAEVNVSPDLPSTVTTAGSPVAAASIGAVVGDIVLEVPTTWTALVEVADTQVGELHPGERADVEVPGLARAVAGVVSTVQPAAQLTDGVAAYPVEVVLENPPVARLDAGMAVTVTIVTRSVHDALSIPLAALHTVGKRTYVDVVDHGRTVRQAVTVGIEGATRAQILGGLHAGESVVLAELNRPLPTGRLQRPGRFLNPPVQHVPANRHAG
jgi:multidrug efflux pump subunit AcrA (membrane-fusion protein)